VKVLVEGSAREVKRYARRPMIFLLGSKSKIRRDRSGKVVRNSKRLMRGAGQAAFEMFRPKTEQESFARNVDAGFRRSMTPRPAPFRRNTIGCQNLPT